MYFLRSLASRSNCACNGYPTDIDGLVAAIALQSAKLRGCCNGSTIRGVSFNQGLH
ncbi:hypothetical protein [Bradyrhizobium sp. DASA03120]|uniref:hypothetical protein n=1 Tax=Bradyrhizobium sp. SMVTL-02 TaxID=3395917 RepID=UPI003F6F746B